MTMSSTSSGSGGVHLCLKHPCRPTVYDGDAVGIFVVRRWTTKMLGGIFHPQKLEMFLLVSPQPLILIQRVESNYGLSGCLSVASLVVEVQVKTVGNF
jgi:hypothetical protein